MEMETVTITVDVEAVNGNVLFGIRIPRVRHIRMGSLDVFMTEIRRRLGEKIMELTSESLGPVREPADSELFLFHRR